MTVGAMIALGAGIGLALGILISLITDLVAAPILRNAASRCAVVALYPGHG